MHTCWLISQEPFKSVLKSSLTQTKTGSTVFSRQIFVSTSERNWADEKDLSTLLSFWKYQTALNEVSLKGRNVKKRYCRQETERWPSGLGLGSMKTEGFFLGTNTWDMAQKIENTNELHGKIVMLATIVKDEMESVNMQDQFISGSTKLILSSSNIMLEER